jgi:surface antigen
MIKNILTILILTILLPISIQAQILDVPEVTQEQDQWCWAGSSISVLKYYGDNEITQCEIATWAWNRADWRSCSDNCCSDPTGCCNYWNYNWGEPGAIDDILENASSSVSIKVNNESQAISQSEVETAISDGRPLIVRVNSGGHFIVLHGLEGNTLYYMDPWYGEGKGYQTFSTSQVNGRDWTHTQTCLTKPTTDPDTEAPSVPQNLTTSNITSSGASLSWSASTDNIGVTGYKVYQGTTLQTTVSGTSYDVTGLTASTEYSYSVSAIDNAGNESAISSEVTFTTKDAGSDPVINICNESISDIHVVDGIPAYSNSECSNTNFGVYSDNGVNTSSQDEGGWRRTQYSGGYQCTEYAHRYLYFKWDIQSVPNGNAGEWLDGTLPSGLEIAETPVHGDIAVFKSGTYGHVAVVDKVDGNQITIVEQNFNNARNRRTIYTSNADGFLHVTANTSNQASNTQATLAETGENSDLSEKNVTEIEQDISYMDKITLYPNPANTQIVFRYEGQKYHKIKFVSVTGKEVKRVDINYGDNLIDISDLAKGIYFISFIDACTANYHEKLIIE